MVIRQMPNGKWNTHVYSDGSTKSFTANTRKECEKKALEYVYRKEREKRTGITLGQAIDAYIASRKNILSPTTLSLYRTIRDHNCQSIMSIPLSLLNEIDVQNAINDEAKTRKPKTVANIRGLLTAALKQNGITMSIAVPQNPKKIFDLPDPKDVMQAVKGKDIELPSLLAMWLSCSMSEIRGIQVSSIHDGYVIIQESMVDVDGESVSKTNTKAYERTRKLLIPDYIMSLIKQTDAWKKGSGYIVPMNRRVIYGHFTKAINDAGLPHMTFHQLRHINASVMATLSIPPTVAMQRGGWKTRSVMEQVYQHVFDSQRQTADQQINGYFERILERN